MKPFLRTQSEKYAERLENLESLLASQDIMADMKAFRDLSKEHAEVTPVAGRLKRYQQVEQDIAGAREMLADPDMAEMAQEEIATGEAELAQLEGELQRLMLPKDPDDARNCFIEVRAGTGGDESALFAADLFRMYTRFAEKKGWRTEIMSESPSELGGYKEVVFKLEGGALDAGVGVYGQMRFESGGHRVQRVPTTETQGRIHTSACTVAVLAEPDEAVAIKN